MDYQIITVSVDHNTDVLTVEAIALDSGKSITAQGWVSAMSNHYSSEDYDEQGNLVEGAQPRSMTPDEKREYILNLVKAVDVRSEMVPQPEEDLIDLFG